MSLVLLLGGARSGKSALAVELGRRFGGDVVFVATAQARDPEMRERIERHRRERAPEWRLIEEPQKLLHVLEAGSSDNELVIVDCLSLWLSNRIELGSSDEGIVEEAQAVAESAARRTGPVIVVSNEVGLGVVPATPLGRRFRDLLGSVNRLFAEHAQTSIFVVAGRALRLEPLNLDELQLWRDHGNG